MSSSFICLVSTPSVGLESTAPGTRVPRSSDGASWGPRRKSSEEPAEKHVLRGEKGLRAVVGDHGGLSTVGKLLTPRRHRRGTEPGPRSPARPSLNLEALTGGAAPHSTAAAFGAALPERYLVGAKASAAPGSCRQKRSPPDRGEPVSAH